MEIELFTDVRAVPGAAFQREVVDPIIEEYVRERTRADLDAALLLWAHGGNRGGDRMRPRRASRAISGSSRRSS